MSKMWYVVHTYSGYENKVKSAIEEKVKTLGKADLFGEVLVPTEKVVGMVKGVKKTSSRKFFPATYSSTWNLRTRRGTYCTVFRS